MSPGIQYWYGFCVSTSGVNVLTAWEGIHARNINNFRGRLQVAATTTIGSGYGPFWGVVSSGAPPVNISSNQPLNGILLNTGANRPAIQFRTNISW